MLFNSSVFLIFIVLFFACWPWARRQNQSRWIYITAASFLFYGWWDWRFLFLLIGSGLVDYFTAIGMERWTRYRKWFAAASVLGNLGSLFIFKYSGFVAENVDALMASVGLQTHLYDSIPEFALILPVGISFYTFQSLNYTLDVYKGELKATRNIFHFFAYLSLFPHLVAGPILRARRMIPQMEKLHIPDEKELWWGMKMIAYGFFCKMVIADNLAPFVNEAFANPEAHTNTLYWWMAVTFFAFQIYYDFNGYSSIALGLLRWMGYDVPLNFNHPYLAFSLKEFWQRWHISLSTWFRDYVYIPLGGSKNNPHLNMWITMLLSGIWHGAAWNFVIWGGLHAAFLSIERITSLPQVLQRSPVGKLLALALTLVQVWVAWVFFRAANVTDAVHIIKGMFSFSFTGASGIKLYHWVLIAVAVLPEGIYALRNKFSAKPEPRYIWSYEMVAVILLLTISVYLRGPGSQFIYFQF